LYERDDNAHDQASQKDGANDLEHNDDAFAADFDNFSFVHDMDNGQESDGLHYNNEGGGLLKRRFGKTA
jgi:hypothetical protein